MIKKIVKKIKIKREWLPLLQTPFPQWFLKAGIPHAVLVPLLFPLCSFLDLTGACG